MSGTRWRASLSICITALGLESILPLLVEFGQGFPRKYRSEDTQGCEGPKALQALMTFSVDALRRQMLGAAVRVLLSTFSPSRSEI
eukprot:6183420-Pleurochrysis_carterae.AAC.3